LSKRPQCRTFNNTECSGTTKETETEDVTCVIDAKHLCVANSKEELAISRSSTVTSNLAELKPQARRDYIKLDTKF
jgi:GTP cyclohydrolase I